MSGTRQWHGLLAAFNRNSVVDSVSTGLQLGDEWLDKIRANLKTAKMVIALFSPDSVGRPWVNFEAGGAWFSDDKKLIPLCIGHLKPATLPKPYSNIQGADLEDEDTPYYLIKAIWKTVRLTGSLPAQFDGGDSDVKKLKNSIDLWDARTRARGNLERIDAGIGMTTYAYTHI
jgi:TIR domain